MHHTDFQSAPACATLCLVKKLHLAQLSIQLFRAPLIPPGKLGRQSEILILLLYQGGFSCISLPGFLLQKPFILNYFHMKYLVLCGRGDTMDFTTSSAKVSTEERRLSKWLSEPRVIYRIKILF